MKPVRSTKPRLIVFGRMPRFGTGKSRLAAGIGAYRTWRFYRQTLDQTLRNLRDPRWDLSFCATPDRLHAAKRFRRCPVLHQHQGTLGRRMVRQFRTSGIRPALIVGTDIPGLKPHDIQAAFRAMARADSVIGPSTDGGFWCIGMRGKRPSPFLLDAITWSHAETRKQTATRLEFQGFRVRHTTAHDDVDDLAAYRKYRSAGSCIRRRKARPAF